MTDRWPPTPHAGGGQGHGRGMAGKHGIMLGVGTASQALNKDLEIVEPGRARLARVTRGGFTTEQSGHFTA
jgi:hypothetical protein